MGNPKNKMVEMENLISKDDDAKSEFESSEEPVP